MQKISKIEDEQLLGLLEDEVSHYLNRASDFTDDMSEEQIADLRSLMAEPEDKDIITESEYRKSTEKWRTKS